MDTQQSKTAYITGTSRGLGKAIAEKLLANGYTVVGLSRTNTLAHKNFVFLKVDLTDLTALQQINFAHSSKKIVLINNAGTIGDIKPVGSLPSSTFEDVSRLNIVAPQVLMNRFIKTFTPTATQGHILNISSGAGKHPIDAWAAYCASKAALDLFSETVAEEWQAREVKNWFIHSIAPGVVDTEMQRTIRKADPNDFKLHQKFENLKQNNELAAPADVAEKLYRVIEKPNQFNKINVSVRDMD